MAEVYTFRITLKNCETKIYRDIECSSLSTVAKLGYTVIATFEGAASHLFGINYKGKRYEIDLGLYDDGTKLIDPIKTKLSSLQLSLGDIMEMDYDYGAGWEFSILLLSIVEMKKGAGTHYPYIIFGKGKGIIEDIFPSELNEIISQIDKTGSIPEIYSVRYEKTLPWDYREFELEYRNMALKSDIEWIQEAYEQTGG